MRQLITVKVIILLPSRCLKLARQLAIWFYRTFDDQRFKSGPFQPPLQPAGATAELKAELNRLKAEKEAALSEVERVKVAAVEAEVARTIARSKAAKAGSSSERFLLSVASERPSRRSRASARSPADRRRARSVSACRRNDTQNATACCRSDE
jgi:type I restriction enzyme R subunit